MSSKKTFNSNTQMNSLPQSIVGRKFWNDAFILIYIFLRYFKQIIISIYFPSYIFFMKRNVLRVRISWLFIGFHYSWWFLMAFVLMLWKTHAHCFFLVAFFHIDSPLSFCLFFREIGCYIKINLLQLRNWRNPSSQSPQFSWIGVDCIIFSIEGRASTWLDFYG